MLKFLMVDDEELIRTGFREKIDWTSLGFEFLEPCANGHQALAAVRAFRPAVVMTDICMPQMDGLELCRILARDFPEVRVVVLSGHDDFEYARESLRNRVVDYLLKPVTSAELSAFLARLGAELSRPRLPTEAEALRALTDGAVPPGRALAWEGGAAAENSAWWFGRLTLFPRPEETPAQALGRVETVLASRATPWSGLAAASLRHGGLVIHVDLAFPGADAAHAAKKAARDASRLLTDLRVAGVAGCGTLGPTGTEAADAAVLRFFRPRLFDTGAAAWPDAPEGERPLAALTARLDVLLSEGDRPRLDAWLVQLTEALSQPPASPTQARQDLARMLGAGGEPLEACADQRALIEAVRHRIRSELAAAADRGATLADRALAQLRDRIAERLGEPDLGIDDISRELQVSPSYLAKLLRRKWETNFSRYLREARISRAKQLLAATNLTTTRIAEQTGFHDYRYFSNQFKRQEGQTPSGYRGQVRAAS